MTGTLDTISPFSYFPEAIRSAAIGETMMPWKALLALLKVEPLPAVFIIALAALVVVGIALTKIPG